MKLVGIKKDTVRTRAEYSLSFRFRLWIALVEDMDLLNMGYRAYHSHIFESFSTWRSGGVNFENSRGRELNIDALKIDDVYGFRGKREQAPLGPKRNIEPAKLSVLHAFFSKKYPELAASFDKNAPISELTTILRSFYTNELDANFSSNDLSDICRLSDGIYLPCISITANGIRRAMKEGRPFLRTVPIFFVCSGLKRDSCIVHKVEFPFRGSYLKQDSIDYEDFARLKTWMDRHAAQETQIYSGVGIPAASEFQSGNPSLLCVLRDRVLYSPCTSTLEILRMEEGEDLEDPYWITVGAREKSGDDIWRSFLFCQGGKHYDMIKNDICFSADFITDLIDLKTSLGMEI